MPSAQQRNALASEQLEYGPVFLNGLTGDLKTVGKHWVMDALRILENRSASASALRTLPLSPSMRKTLLKRSIDFLQVNQQGPFERDNLKHVGRLISNMKVHGSTLQEFLGMESEDLQLLAALHDLGKAKAPVEMLKYLGSIFTPDDFLSIRVLPHELFSFYWIERLGAEVGVSPEVRQLLMDQVANHNLGPDLNDPNNKFLLAKDPNGRYRHWWVEHWTTWSTKATTAGLTVSSTYGHTVSPLANALVLFDRIDGGHPHSWEKFLNQDLITGRLQFNATNILDVMEHANSTARQQLTAVGTTLSTHFVAGKKGSSVEKLAPYSEANRMLDKNDKIVEQLAQSNAPQHFKKFGVDPSQNILYCDQDKHWFRFEAQSPQSHAYRLEGKAWTLTKSSTNPIALLLGIIYQDWE